MSDNSCRIDYLESLLHELCVALKEESSVPESVREAANDIIWRLYD